jgi:hypothetical protein
MNGWEQFPPAFFNPNSLFYTTPPPKILLTCRAIQN